MAVDVSVHTLRLEQVYDRRISANNAREKIALSLRLRSGLSQGMLGVWKRQYEATPATGMCQANLRGLSDEVTLAYGAV
jgi:hypothetical protein